MDNKSYLRKEYRKARHAFIQMMSDDRNKYIIPAGEQKKYLPPIPKIISNEKEFRSTTAARLQGSINRLKSKVEQYKKARRGWEKYDDAILRAFEGRVSMMLTGSYIPEYVPLHSDPSNDEYIERAYVIYKSLMDRIKKDKRHRSIVSARISKRWENVVKATENYVYGYLMLRDEPKLRPLLLRTALELIFKPLPGEPLYEEFNTTWNDIAQEVESLAYDSGIDDYWEEFY